MNLIWIVIVVWATIWGTCGALIGPRKGRTPGGGFALCAVFGIFGVAYLALQPDEQPFVYTAVPVAPKSPGRRMARTYSGESIEEAEGMASAAVGELAAGGWTKVGEQRSGLSITVTYRSRG